MDLLNNLVKEFVIQQQDYQAEIKQHEQSNSALQTQLIQFKKEYTKQINEQRNEHLLNLEKMSQEDRLTITKLKQENTKLKKEYSKIIHEKDTIINDLKTQNSQLTATTHAKKPQSEHKSTQKELPQIIGISPDNCYITDNDMLLITTEYAHQIAKLAVEIDRTYQ